MALTADVLNSDATLNLWIVLRSRDFIPGEEIKLVFRLKNPDVDLRFIPPAATIVDFSFLKTDGTSLVKTAALNPDDRSFATLTLQESETLDLIGGAVTFDLDSGGTGTTILKGVIANPLRKVTTDC